MLHAQRLFLAWHLLAAVVVWRLLRGVKLLDGVSLVLNTLHVSGLCWGQMLLIQCHPRRALSCSHLIHSAKTRCGSVSAVPLGAPSTSSVEDTNNF